MDVFLILLWLHSWYGFCRYGGDPDQPQGPLI